MLNKHADLHRMGIGHLAVTRMTEPSGDIRKHIRKHADAEDGHDDDGDACYQDGSLDDGEHG